MKLLVYNLFIVVLLVLDIFNINRSTGSGIIAVTGKQIERAQAAAAEEEEVRLTIHQRRMMQHPHIVGGYAPITDLNTNTRVQEIAQYILETLITSAVTNNDKHTYSFQSQFMDVPNETQPEPPPSSSSSAWSTTVVSGKQQVVAGMNYHLTIIISKTATITFITSSMNESHKNHDDEPNNTSTLVVGGCEVVVYDQFGTLSITRWGTEISIQEANGLLTTYNKGNDNDPETTTDVNAILDSEGKF